jgi:hypothetical protein
LVEDDDLSDACPITPDEARPPKSAMTYALDFLDGFFEDWRNALMVMAFAAMILAYGLLTVPPPLAVSVPTPDSWSRELPEPEQYFYSVMPFTPGYEKVVTIEEDLVLTGDETLEIENCTYIVNGPVSLSGNSKLVLRDAELYIPETVVWVYLDERTYRVLAITLTDSSELIVENSQITGQYGRFSIWLHGGSSADVTSSDLEGGGIILENDTVLEIEQTKLSTISMADNAQSTIKDCELFILSPSQITGEGESRESGLNARAEVSDSKIVYLGLKIVESRGVELSPDTLRLESGWSPPTSLGIDGKAFDVVLQRTDVEYLMLTAIDCSLEATGETKLKALWLYSSEATIKYNDLLSLSSFEGSEAIVEEALIGHVIPNGSCVNHFIDSKINRLFLEDFTGELVFDNSLIDHTELMGDTDLTLRGTVAFAEGNFDEYLGTNNRFRFNYRVQASDGERVVPGVELTLRDQEGMVIWEGKTDQEGQATFDVLYHHLWQESLGKYVNDFDDARTLTATKVGTTHETQIKAFETSTLIEYAFPPQPQTLPSTPILRQALIAISAAAILVTIGFKLRRSP